MINTDFTQIDFYVFFKRILLSTHDAFSFDYVGLNNIHGTISVIKDYEDFVITNKEQTLSIHVEEQRIEKNGKEWQTKLSFIKVSNLKFDYIQDGDFLHLFSFYKNVLSVNTTVYYKFINTKKIKIPLSFWGHTFNEFVKDTSCFNEVYIKKTLGLVLKIHNYSARYSDFGSDNYIISIVGDSEYYYMCNKQKLVYHINPADTISVYGKDYSHSNSQHNIKNFNDLKFYIFVNRNETLIEEEKTFNEHFYNSKIFVCDNFDSVADNKYVLDDRKHEPTFKDKTFQPADYLKQNSFILTKAYI